MKNKNLGEESQSKIRGFMEYIKLDSRYILY